MNEIKITIDKAENLRGVLSAGIAVVQLVSESLVEDGWEYSEALYGAMMVLQQAHNIVDDLVEEALHE